MGYRDEFLNYNEKILEKFNDAIGNKVKHLKNLDTINGLIGAIPILEEILNTNDDLFGMIVIQKESTNGDVMKALFDISLDDFKHKWGGGDITDDWWNAPYERGENDTCIMT